MEYRIDDKMLNASAFLTFVNQVWPGDYDIEKTKNALFIELLYALITTAFPVLRLAGTICVLLLFSCIKYVKLLYLCNKS